MPERFLGGSLGNMDMVKALLAVPNCRFLGGATLGMARAAWPLRGRYIPRAVPFWAWSLGGAYGWLLLTWPAWCGAEPDHDERKRRWDSKLPGPPIAEG